MEHVNKIRKQWLIALLFFYGVVPMAALCGCTYLVLKENLGSEAFLFLTIGDLLSLAIGFSLYRCSYLKQGTKFLKVVTVFYQSGLACSISMFVGKDINIGWYAFLFVQIALCVWWSVSSSRLMKANKQVAHTA
ncbi:MAG: hypothetical protein H7A40_01750 [Chlamydiales bacterium]|nr:hypothetical protein [Chlamydiales bacterium]